MIYDCCLYEPMSRSKDQSSKRSSGQSQSCSEEEGSVVWWYGAAGRAQRSYWIFSSYRDFNYRRLSSLSLNLALTPIPIPLRMVRVAARLGSDCLR